MIRKKTPLNRELTKITCSHCNRQASKAFKAARNKQPATCYLFFFFFLTIQCLSVI